MTKFEPGTQVEIHTAGEWVGPFTVTDGKGRTPDHLVLTGPSGAFEHYNDAPFNVRKVGEYRRLGRFDSALDEVLYYLASSEDWAADHDGDQSDFGAYAWCMTIEEPLEGEELATVQRLAEEANPGHPIAPELVYGHWVVSVGSLGFVHVEKLPDEEQLDNLWTAFKESYERWAEENPDE